ncbi:hypothetical protein [Pelovirga terrestris]|uniref:Uncharacterized protein n=1 Tax=Pelovirga terrestris TaxID=2771352 RepID=A0A8J6QXB4_9BACT|nr:hypothetical protein [Pelovirga terrestris]MBD1400626.1 hypothetical protein [Pelovirga terrestris]
MHHHRQQLWQQIVTEVQEHYQNLGQDEKDWLSPKLSAIADLQGRLNDLFVTADGEHHCRACAGGCCHAGHNHMTLVNLLHYVARQQPLPAPDFRQSCPFLGAQGCLLPPSRRPYNCISFNCDIIESCWSDADLKQFYRIESELRRHYLTLARRYAGAAMTGLLLQYARLQGRSFFYLLPATKPKDLCHDDLEF